MKRWLLSVTLLLSAATLPVRYHPVGAKQLKDIPVSSAAEALQGKLAGVQVVSSEECTRCGCRDPCSWWWFYHTGQLTTVYR